jgi:predicted dehydrogenase
MAKLKIGVIGVGHLGRLHTKMFTQIESCEFVGVFDQNREQTLNCAKEFNVKSFETMKDLLDHVDAVSIAVTTSAHHEIAKQCLEKNKHVFVEKPITATIAEAQELVKIASDHKLNLQVGHIERFNPALVSLEKYNIAPMFIQTDRLAQFNPRGTDVAVVLDLMIHDIDIILSLVKSPVKSIDASGVAVVSDTLDIANARIEFENGAVANVTASRISQKKMRKMRMFQRDTYISLDFTDGVSEVFKLYPADEKVDAAHISYGEIGIGEKTKKVVYEQPEVLEINALKYELSLFVDSVINKTRPVVSGEDGLKALIVADTIIRKIEAAHIEDKI